MLPFSSDDVITNLSNIQLTAEELDLLKNGLDFAIPPRQVSKTDIFMEFEKIHRLLTYEIKDKDKKSEFKTQMSHLAINYYANYKPTKAALRKHGILRRLRSNKKIIITKPEKGNGVVILDWDTYIEKMNELISDKNNL